MDLERRIKDTFESVGMPSELRAIKGRARRTRNVRRASATGVVVVAIAAAAIVAPGLVPRGETNAAAAALHGLAAAARQAPVITVGPDQYLYTKQIARHQNCADDGCVWRTSTRETWAAEDGSGRFAGKEGNAPAYSEVVGPGELGGSFNETTPPSDVDGLRAFIEERAAQAEQPLDYEMFVVVRDLLVQTWSSPTLYSTPELRASLFEVASTLQGVEDLGPTKDDIGRPGVGIGFTKDGWQVELIFDPDTGEILGGREHSAADAVQDGGRVAREAVFVTVGVVDSIQDRP